MIKKIISTILFVIVLVFAIMPWWGLDEIPSEAMQAISAEIEAEGIAASQQSETGEYMCDGLGIGRVPFALIVSTCDARWVVPFWGKAYRWR